MLVATIFSTDVDQIVFDEPSHKYLDADPSIDCGTMTYTLSLKLQDLSNPPADYFIQMDVITRTITLQDSNGDLTIQDASDHDPLTPEIIYLHIEM